MLLLLKFWHTARPHSGARERRSLSAFVKGWAGARPPRAPAARQPGPAGTHGLHSLDRPADTGPTESPWPHWQASSRGQRMPGFRVKSRKFRIRFNRG
jgi:hypothetical protein